MYTPLKEMVKSKTPLDNKEKLKLDETLNLPEVTASLKETKGTMAFFCTGRDTVSRLTRFEKGAKWHIVKDLYNCLTNITLKEK